MRRVTYDIPVNGLATDFAESELPLNFALRFRNRFINKVGGAEKRRGLEQFGNTIAAGTVDGLHEHVDEVGNETQMASISNAIYRYDDPGWTLVHTLPTAGKVRSTHFQDKLIFYNGTDRAVFTEDATNFSTLKALLEKGLGGDETSATRLNNADITDWSSGTSVAVNDIVFYPSLGSPAGSGAYGLVVSVSASAVNTTPVSANANGIGVSVSEPATNTPFEIIDTVPLNLVDNGIELDNTAIGTSGTSTTTIAVSGTDFTTTEARVGDFVRNTTQASVTQITAVAASALTVTAVSGQTTGDSFVFLKSALPIPYDVHTHYNRVYYVDARDRRRIIVSDEYDAQGFTTGSTLDDITFFAGALQPQGDVVVALASFQSFLVIGGEHNIFFYSGTTPIGANADVIPVGLFPQGVIAQDGMLTIGNRLIFVGHDGVQAVSQISDATQLGQDQITFPINDTLRDELDSVSSSDDIILFHYRQRSWACLKVGTSMYVLNYSTRARQEGIVDREQVAGSISLFDGLIAQGSSYFERRSDKLLIGGAGGKVYIFDNAGVYTDDGASYSTDLLTGWLMLERPGTKSTTIKALKYIEPIFEGAGTIEYTINGTGGFEFDSSDTIVVAASSNTSQVGTAVIPFVIGGGAPISSVKHSLRVRGEAIQIQFQTDDSLGPDTISRYTLYAAVHGAQ